MISIVVATSKVVPSTKDDMTARSQCLKRRGVKSRGSSGTDGQRRGPMRCDDQKKVDSFTPLNECKRTPEERRRRRRQCTGKRHRSTPPRYTRLTQPSHGRASGRGCVHVSVVYVQPSARANRQKREKRKSRARTFVRTHANARARRSAFDGPHNDQVGSPAFCLDKRPARGKRK